LRQTPLALEVSVTDDGSGLGTAAAGVGITSMRERATELGGSLVVADGAHGGTVVRARLPLAGAEPDRTAVLHG
jgi:two-component system, NarL family, sensor kinase